MCANAVLPWMTWITNQKDGREGGQEGIAAPAVPESLAEVADGRRVEVRAEVLPETVQGDINPLRRRGASWITGRVATP